MKTVIHISKINCLWIPHQNDVANHLSYLTMINYSYTDSFHSFFYPEISDANDHRYIEERIKIERYIDIIFI